MIDTAGDVLTPVIESSVILGSHYAHACGRTTVTGKDIAYGLMYAARHVAGNQIGSLFPEDEEDEEEDEDDLEVVSDTDEPFTRYEGTEEIFVNMNRCADTWDTWEPLSPIEHMIKSAVDKARESVE
jgi:hypothetical protein